uniref:Uncharacterized protein n=1 Tax=Cacopsylla melanoneura TaxID=428564 RepID=A0A8D8Y1S7_9HEMI
MVPTVHAPPHVPVFKPPATCFDTLPPPPSTHQSHPRCILLLTIITLIIRSQTQATITPMCDFMEMSPMIKVRTPATITHRMMSTSNLTSTASPKQTPCITPHAPFKWKTLTRIP